MFTPKPPPGSRSDAAALCALARERGALSIVDTVTSLGGIELLVDELGCGRGLFRHPEMPVLCSRHLSGHFQSAARLSASSNRQHKVQSWFLDMQLVMGYWGGSSKRAYHHTAPVNNLYALHESLLMLREEGLEAAHARHRHNHEALVAGLEAMGLAMAVAAPHRLPQLNSVLIPEGVDDAAVRSALLQ